MPAIHLPQYSPLGSVYILERGHVATLLKHDSLKVSSVVIQVLADRPQSSVAISVTLSKGPHGMHRWLEVRLRSVMMLRWIGRLQHHSSSVCILASPGIALGSPSRRGDISKLLRSPIPCIFWGAPG
ncbi:hypothetical protein XELAEV_18003822mg [Xenopus laevis]|nr:hypothetical protein XELAEV_18003822mg [Xenopus laevis]